MSPVMSGRKRAKHHICEAIEKYVCENNFVH